MEPSAELQGVIRGWFESVSKGDASWLEKHLSTAGAFRVIGTDPTEWLQGQKAADLLRADLSVMGGSVTIQVREVEAYSEGNVGWGAALPVITLEDGKKISPRWSAVFHREAGEWKLLQVHASVGVTNEQLFGVEFPS